MTRFFVPVSVSDEKMREIFLNLKPYSDIKDLTAFANGFVFYADLSHRPIGEITRVVTKCLSLSGIHVELEIIEN